MGSSKFVISLDGEHYKMLKHILLSFAFIGVFSIVSGLPPCYNCGPNHEDDGREIVALKELPGLFRFSRKDLRRQADSTQTEPTRPKPTRPDPTRPEPTRPEPTRPEPTRPEPTRPEPIRPEPTDQNQLEPSQQDHN